jgi:hypothetical protein
MERPWAVHGPLAGRRKTGTTTAYDELTVTAGSTTLATWSNLDEATGHVRKSVDLSSLAGSGGVTLTCGGVEDSSLRTGFVIGGTAVTTS